MINMTQKSSIAPEDMFTWFVDGRWLNIFYNYDPAYAITDCRSLSRWLTYARKGGTYSDMNYYYTDFFDYDFTKVIQGATPSLALLPRGAMGNDVVLKLSEFPLAANRQIGIGVVNNSGSVSVAVYDSNWVEQSVLFTVPACTNGYVTVNGQNITTARYCSTNDRIVVDGYVLIFTDTQLQVCRNGNIIGQVAYTPSGELVNVGIKLTSDGWVTAAALA